MILSPVHQSSPLVQSSDCRLPHFNMDETGLSIDPKPLKTIHFKGEKNPVATGSVQKNNTNHSCGMW